jgi:hypothetical protein
MPGAYGAPGMVLPGQVGFAGNMGQPGFVGNMGQPGFAGNMGQPGFAGNMLQSGYGGNIGQGLPLQGANMNPGFVQSNLRISRTTPAGIVRI